MATKRTRSPSLGDREPTKKPRAAKACQSCRSRKVRCDIVICGSPCTNCKLDCIDCVLLISRRGWKGGKRQPEALDRPTTLLQEVSYERLNYDTGLATNSMETKQGIYSAEGPITATDDDVPMCMTFHGEYGRNVHASHRGHERISEHPTTHSNSHHSAGNDHGIDGLSRVTDNQPPSGPAFTRADQCSGLSNVNLQLPTFIMSLPSHMDPEVVAFLATRGALEVPEAELRDEILRSYIFSIHPFMPILDLQELVNAISHEGIGEYPRISLLLFQAVMFAGLASLNPEMVRLTGCGTIKQARKVYFAKVRLLYDLDIEPNNMVVLQTLLLMSLWYDKWNDSKDTWHWTGLALSLACSEGLNRENAESDILPRVRSHRRRLWWSLYTRDRLIALATRRTTRIRDDEFDVPTLTSQDFDSYVVDEASETSHVSMTEFQDRSQSSALALMYVELTKLCVCIGRVLSSQYTTLGERSALTSAMIVVPRSSQERAQQLEKRNTELEEWFQDLHPQIHAVAQETAANPSTTALAIHWSLLYMIQLTAMSILHRPQVLQPGSSDNVAQAQRVSHDKVNHASRQLTKITHAMLRRDQVRFLSTSGVPALVSASLGHMLDIKSDDENIRDASIFRFYQTMQVLQRLREIYASADSAVSFLATAVRKAGVSVSVQLAAQATPEFMIASPNARFARTMIQNPSASTSNVVLAALPSPSNTDSQEAANQANVRSANVQSVNTTKPASLATSNETFGHNDHSVARQQVYDPGYTSNTNLIPGTTVPWPCASATSNNPAYSSKTAEQELITSWDSNDLTISHPMSYWMGNGDLLDLNGSFAHDINGESIAPDYDFISDAFGLLDVPALPRNDKSKILVDRISKNSTYGDNTIRFSR